MALKILITNDDGIYAEGIKLLVDEAKKYGSVMVVAPKVETSKLEQKTTNENINQNKTINTTAKSGRVGQ